MNEVQELIDAILNTPPGPGTQLSPNQTSDGQIAAGMRQEANLQLSRHPKAAIRMEAAEMLADHSSPQAMLALLQLCSDSDSGVRQQALQSLEGYQAPEVSKALIEALNDSDYLVRASAAELLGNRSDPSAVEPLIQSLKDSYYMVRATAAEALGKMEAFMAASALRDLLLDSDQWVRYSAAESLGQIEPDEHIWQVLMEANCTDPTTRLEAVKDLQQLADSRAIPTLIRLLKDETDISSAALTTLESFHDPIVVPALVETALFTEHAHIREQALLQSQHISLEATIGALSSWLVAEQVHFAQQAAEVLRQLPTLDTTPIFLDALEHDDIWVRTVAMLTLNQRQAEIPADKLLPLLQESEADLVTAALNSALRLYPEQALSDIDRFLNSGQLWQQEVLAENVFLLPTPLRQEYAQQLYQSPESSIRESVVKSLGKAGQPEDLVLLLETQKDPDSWVRQATVASLESLSSEQSEQILIRLLRQDPDFMVRARAAEALADHTRPEISAALESALSDSKPSVRVQVVISLFHHPEHPSKKALESILQDPDKNVLLTCLEHLQRKPISGAHQQVAKYLDSEDIQLSSAAKATYSILVDK